MSEFFLNTVSLKKTIDIKKKLEYNFLYFNNNENLATPNYLNELKDSINYLTFLIETYIELSSSENNEDLDDYILHYNPFWSNFHKTVFICSETLEYYKFLLSKSDKIELETGRIFKGNYQDLIKKLEANHHIII